MRLKSIRVRTEYWTPGTDFVEAITSSVECIVQEGDIVTVSEKAIATASGLLIDEARVRPGSLARFLASFWMRRVWGGPLGLITKLRSQTLDRLRGFPIGICASHKQVALAHAGFLQALRHYSEGGIDGSNIPYSLVSLPLADPCSVVMKIREAIGEETGKKVTVMVVDGDTTFTWRNLHLAPRRVAVPGLVHIGGFLTFVFGRIFGLRSRPTPIAVTCEEMNPDWALTLSNIAHRVRGHGAGRTVWDMSERLGVDIEEVTWDMLDRVEHYPIVVIRRVAED